MFITHFNRLCQKHSRLAFLIIGVLIIVPFVFIWGSPRDFMRGNRFGRDQVGKIYGRTLSHATFMEQLTATEMAIFMRYGQLISRENSMRDYWVDETLRRMRSMHEARRRGLDQVSDAEVAKEIQGLAFFQREGQFDPDMFEMFSKNFLKSRGLDGEKFDAIIRDNIAIARVEAQASAGAFVAPDEVRADYDQRNEKYTAAVCNLNFFDFMKDGEWQPSAAEVEAYYQTHKAEFTDKDAGAAAPELPLTEELKKTIAGKLQDSRARAFYRDRVEKFRSRLADGKTPDDLKKAYAEELEKMPGKNEEQKDALRKGFDADVNDYLVPYFVPEQKRARVASFSVDKFVPQVKVTDAQIQDSFEKNKAEYSKEEVQAQHILLKVSPEAKPEEKDAVRKTAEDLHKKILAGADFSELAKKHSQDPGSKDKGGDLGWFGKGQMVAPFEQAAFALKKGDVSEIVESSFGLHLIKVLDKRAGRTLADVKGEIQTKLTNDEAQKLAGKAAEAFGDTVFKALDAGGGVPGTKVGDLFAKIAGQEKVEYKDTEWFKNRGPVQPFGFEMELSRQAFKLTEQGALSETIKGKNVFYVACWLASKASYLPEFGQEAGLSARVRSQETRERAVAIARERARKAFDELQAKLAGGATLDAAKGELKFQDIPEFSHQQPPAKVADGRGVLEAVAGGKANTLLSPLETATGAVLVFLKAKTLPGDAEFAKEKDSMVEQLKRQKESAALQAFHKKLEAESATELSEQWKPKKQGRGGL